jgi:hypothetical protein
MIILTSYFSKYVRQVLVLVLVVAGVAVYASQSVVQAQSVAQAQEESLEDQNSTQAAQVIFANPAQNARIAALQELYSQQVAAYQVAERDYLLAKTQHQKLQSLISLEEAVKATQQAMQRRSDVLLSYLDLLYAQLQDTLGLELSYKEAGSQQLEDTIAVLRAHRTSLDSSTSVDALAAATAEFKPLYEQIQRDSEKTRSLIATGRMQLVYDKAQIVRSDIQKLQQEYEVSTLKKSERDRAYVEIEKQFKTVYDALRLVREEVGGEKSNISYSSTSGKLLGVSANLSRVLSYLEEVLRI